MLKEARPDAGRVPVLAHPVAEPRGVPHLPVAGRDPRRPARQRPAGVPHPVPLQQLPRNGGPRRSRPASTASASRCTAAAIAPSSSPYPISIDPGAVATVAPGPDWETRRRRRRAGALRHSATRRLRHGRRPARLHQGHPRAAAGLRAPARPPTRNGAGAFASCRSARRRRDAASSATRRSAPRCSRRSTAINRRFGTAALDAGRLPPRAPRAGGGRRVLPGRRRMRRVVAARRHEPGGQGVRRRARPTSRACWCCRSSPARRARWPTSCRSIRSRPTSLPRRCIRRCRCPPTSSGAGCGTCAGGAVAHRVRLGRPPAVRGVPARQRHPLTVRRDPRHARHVGRRRDRARTARRGTRLRQTAREGTRSRGRPRPTAQPVRSGMVFWPALMGTLTACG